MKTIGTQSSKTPNNKGKFKQRIVRTEQHQLHEGLVIYRTPHSGDVWQYQEWDFTNKKYIRKSTRTRNLDEAIRVGKDIYLDIHSKLRTKEPVFPKTMREVVNEFLEQKKKDIGIARKI